MQRVLLFVGSAWSVILATLAISQYSSFYNFCRKGSRKLTKVFITE